MTRDASPDTPPLPSELPLPVELAEEFAARPDLAAIWDSYTPEHQQEHLAWIFSADTDATRARRVRSTVEELERKAD